MAVIHKHRYILLLLILTILVGQMVSAANISQEMSQNLTVNKTFTLDGGGTTPVTLWLGAIILGIVLIILSFHQFGNGEEGLVSIMAWIPWAFAMYTSMAVDVITNAGTVSSTSGVTMVESHTIYQFNLIAMLCLIGLAGAIGNTWRIWVSQKKMKELSEGPTAENFDY